MRDIQAHESPMLEMLTLEEPQNLQRLLQKTRGLFERS